MTSTSPHSSQPPRFALLHHTMEAIAGRSDHWDLMFERDGVLVTLEVERLPSEAQTFLARRLPDHRLLYLDYEGHIAGNRGHVIRLDRGPYQEIDLSESSNAHSEGRYRYLLQGQRLSATIACDQPLHLLPFAQPVHLLAPQWHWHD